MSFFDKYPNIYYNPVTMSGIDFATTDGVTSINQQTKEEVLERFPTAVLATWEEFEALKEAHDEQRFSTVVEIDEDRYDDMLNVMPPDNWVQQGRVAMFQLCEFTTGSWTMTFLKWGDRYFETTCKVKIKLPDLVGKVKTAFDLEAL